MPDVDRLDEELRQARRMVSEGFWQAFAEALAQRPTECCPAATVAVVARERALTATESEVTAALALWLSFGPEAQRACLQAALVVLQGRKGPDSGSMPEAPIGA